MTSVTACTIVPRILPHLCSALAELGPSIADLERQLADAVAAERYDQAAELRDSLAAAMHDGKTAVEFANEKFYRAFASCDVDAMELVWGEGDHVQCTHPSMPALVGACASSAASG